MSDVAFAITRPHRKRGVPEAGKRVASIPDHENFAQGLVDLCIAGDEPAADCAQDIGGVENCISRGVGMDDAAAGVDENNAGAQPVQDIGKTRSLALLQIDGLADTQRAADVGHDERHALAHFVIDRPPRLVPDDTEKRAAGRRFIDHHAGDVAPAMRPRPLPIKAAPAKFLIGHEIRRAHDLFDACARQVGGQIEFRIALRIDLQALGVGPDITVQAFRFARRMFRQNPAGLPPGKARDLIDHVEFVAQGRVPHHRCHQSTPTVALYRSSFFASVKVEENGAAKLATALPRFGDCDSNGISEAVGFCLTIARRDAVMTLLSTSLADLALTSA